MPQTVSSALRRAGWLAGLVPLAAIWAGVALWVGPGIAIKVAATAEPVVASTADSHGEPWLRIAARGRDLVAQGEAPDEAARAIALARLAVLDGPRRVVSEIGLVETAAPFQWAATWTGRSGVTLEGNRPVEIGRRALEVEVTGAIGANTPLRDSARAARGAPPDFPAAAAFLAARLPSLAPGGRAVLTDTVLSLSGEAVDLAAYDSLRAALSRPPDGFSLGKVEILPPRIADYSFSVARRGLGIALSGYVPSEAARQAALAMGRSVTGGGPVEDKLQAARGLPDSIDPAALVEFMGKLAALIQSGEVVYSGGAVALRGDAIDPQAIPEAQALQREARPAGLSAGSVTLTAKPLSPYRVSLRRTPEAVTLTGHLPDEETRRRVLSALRQRLYREPVMDRTRLADGAPAGLATALETAAGLLSTLATGEATVTDRNLSLLGETLYPEAAARAPTQVAKLLPPGWTGEVGVDPKDPVSPRDAESCRQGVAAATATADFRFPVGSTALTPAFYPALDALAALAKTCPDLRLAVSGPADPPGSKPPEDPKPKVAEKKKPADKKPAPEPAAEAKPAEAKPAEEETSGLARQRALALVEYLLQAGMRPAQISAGPDKAAGPAIVALAP